MKKHQQTEVQFSLKDELFNKEKVHMLGNELKAAYPLFDQKGFERAVVSKFPEQELMERLRGIRDQLRAFLPKDYAKALAIILKALPEELDPTKTDNDFGSFIYGPYSYFVATYGCTEKHVDRSLAALKEMTKRFSAEGAIRDFFNAFPKETMHVVKAWAKDSNYHVRRLASEGSRPFLPWAKRIQQSPEEMIPILDLLFSDNTRYVTRSVANHMNDIAKTDPKLVVTTLRKWKKSKKQDAKEMEFIIKHSLRTLVKDGNKDALRLLAYDSKHIAVKSFKLEDTKVKVGESLSFSFRVVSTADKMQNVLLDYIVYFKKANGTLAPKTFKIAQKKLDGGEAVTITKKHPLKLMSTRALYTGEHIIELQINGRSFGKKKFTIL